MEGLEGIPGMPGIPRPLEGEDGFPPLPMVDDEKPRKRRQGIGQGRRKSQLQENFPAYMQVRLLCNDFKWSFFYGL